MLRGRCIQNNRANGQAGVALWRGSLCAWRGGSHEHEQSHRFALNLRASGRDKANSARVVRMPTERCSGAAG